ncbi:hypothetical protein DFH09DRAFT_1090938 [Mycena vulgaris]|nr:hypothetical protein DFH09DRAFT_1090938 [Mycena vulgaris]
MPVTRDFREKALIWALGEFVLRQSPDAREGRLSFSGAQYHSNVNVPSINLELFIGAFRTSDRSEYLRETCCVGWPRLDRLGSDASELILRRFQEMGVIGEKDGVEGNWEEAACGEIRTGFGDDGEWPKGARQLAPSALSGTTLAELNMSDANKSESYCRSLSQAKRALAIARVLFFSSILPSGLWELSATSGNPGVNFNTCL